MSLEQLKLDLINSFDIVSHEINIDKNILEIQKWNWDYEIAHSVQLKCVEYVLANENDIVLIFCSHPKTFTMGRGLQKLKSESNIQLIEFDPILKNDLKTSVVDIKRGGGLTFHHPGQFVFYPILKTTRIQLKVHDLMIDILSMTKKALLKNHPHMNLEVNTDLLGLWSVDNNLKNKVASIGLAVNRFVTYHGLALNYFKDESFESELLRVFPCGLPGNVYRAIGELTPVDEASFNFFKTSFKNNFYEMIERQRSSLPIVLETSSIDNDKNLLESNLNTESSLS